ncbi:MAG TPA: T9SS type A sorting domain-containing protein, partial [Bacteroidia bacterium]|nr:T9SS type A sorting domain-containing protein [Bacteroidia bacterium]
GVACDSAQVLNGTDAILETDPIDLTGFFFVSVTFQHICRIDFFDAANIDVSIDGGMTWSTLGPAEFDSTLADYGAFGGQGYFSSATSLDWDPGVPGTMPTNSMWHLARFNLSQWGGVSDFRMRFRLSDVNGGGAGGYPGWFIDDICIQAAVCELNPPNIAFTSGYPQGTIYNLGPYNVQSHITDASGIMSATLTYTINNGTPVSVPMTDLGNGDFTGQIPAVNDGDSICYSITALDNSGCANSAVFPTSGCITFYASQGITFPFCDNFDLQNLWTDSVGNANSTHWQRGQSTVWPGSAHSAPNIWEVGLDQQYVGSCISYLYSPTFSFIGVFNAQIEFWINSNCENFWDGARLDYSTDNGLTWSVLGTNNTTFPTGQNWYNDDQLNSSQTYAWTGSSQVISGAPGWFKAMHKLTVLDNQTSVMFRFVFTSDASVQLDGFAIDDVCIFVPPPQDAGVQIISQPPVQAPAGLCIPVEVTITNFGSQPITSTPVTYTSSTGATQTATWTGNLAPGASTVFTITPCLTIPSGPFTVCAYTSLPNDGLPFNDTTCISSTGIPVLTLTSCDDFESGNVGWLSTPTGGANEWQLGTPAFGATTGAYSGTNAWDINLNTGYVQNEIDTLYTPIYDITGLSASNLTMSFFSNYSTANTDGFWVEYTIDGTNWSILGTMGDPNASNWYTTANLDFTNNPAFNNNSGGWKKSTYFLNNLLITNPTTIRFRFVFYATTFGTGGVGVSLDNFCVSIPCSPDAGVTAVGSYNASIGNTLMQGSADSVQVTIHNYGTAAVTSLNIAYAINGTPVLPPYAWTGNLAPNGNATIILPTSYTTPGGQYTITAWTDLTSDCNSANDTLAGAAVGVPVIVVDFNNSYCDDFENGNIGWSTKNNSTTPGSDWQFGTPTFGTTNSAYSGVNCWDINLNSVYGANANSELYTPIFDLSNAVDATISFWQNVASESNWDGTRMEYRIGNGAWTILGTPCDTLTMGQFNWYNDNQLNSSQQYAWTQGNALCALPTGWIRSMRKLEPIFNNQPMVQFRYIFNSDGSVQTNGYSIDDFCVNVPVPLTVTPVAVSTANPGPPFIFPGQSMPFKSKIYNDGTSAVNNFVATLSVDGNIISNDTVTLATPLNPNTNMNYTFVNGWIASPGFHNVCVSTYYPNQSADLKPIGDTICYSVQVFDSATVGAGSSSKCYDFESGYRWVTLNSTSYSANSSWDLGTSVKLGGNHSPVNSWFTSLAGQYPNRDTSALFSPVFTLTGGLTYNINFWHSFMTERNEDGGTFEYSTNLGATWIQLGDDHDPNWMNTYSITALGPVPPVHPGWSGNSGGWGQVGHDICLPTAGQQQVIFRWRFNSDFSVRDEGWAIDDVCLEVKSPITLCTTGLTDLNNTFDMIQNTPNPFSDYSVITFNLSDNGSTQLDIVDVTGKVLMTPVNSNLSAGTYNITVSAENLASGVYFYVLKHNDRQLVKKMVIAK